jgi:hypothetical protein
MKISHSFEELRKERELLRKQQYEEKYAKKVR